MILLATLISINECKAHLAQSNCIHDHSRIVFITTVELYSRPTFDWDLYLFVGTRAVSENMIYCLVETIGCLHGAMPNVINMSMLIY